MSPLTSIVKSPLLLTVAGSAVNCPPIRLIVPFESIVGISMFAPKLPDTPFTENVEFASLAFAIEPAS